MMKSPDSILPAIAQPECWYINFHRMKKRGTTATGATNRRAWEIRGTSMQFAQWEHSMKSKFVKLGAAALMAASLWAPAAYAQAPESSDPIKIALFDWTSVNLNAKILGGILEKLGYTVEYPTADYLSSLTTGLTNGDLTVGMEFWDTTAGEAMAASDATGQTEKLGPLGPQGQGRVVVSDLHEGEVPGPAQLGSAEGSEMRRGLLDAGNRAERPLSRRPGDLGRLRRRARRLARPALHRHPCRHRRARCSPSWTPPISARRRSCCGSIRRTGRRPSTRANGSNSRTTRRSATTDPAWGSNTDWPSMTAASRPAKSGNIPGAA